MSELNDGFFKRLAQKMPGYKRQVGQAIQKRKACSNGKCGSPMPICGVCGKQFSIKTTLVIGAPIPKNCPDCQGELDGGSGAFVTLEKPARYWIGKGVKPEFAGHVTILSTEEMDAVLRAYEKLKAEKTADGVKQS